MVRGRLTAAVATALLATACTGPVGTAPSDSASGAAAFPRAALKPSVAVPPGSEHPVSAPRPRIVNRPIPFGAARKRQMARYSRKHYGTAEWRLTPRLIVEHYTATRSLQSVFATFAANHPDPELGQLPGVCTHFVIAADGTIYQLVPLPVRCRHAVGLNDHAIGIEHVGISDADVMGDRRQRRASLQLTAWLAVRYRIGVGDVIGHSESRASRFHHERYRPWRCQTHADFSRPTMNRYRSLLRKRLIGTGVDLSPPRWRRVPC